MNHLHIYGIFLRNIILLKRSMPRLFGMFGFVTFELFLWGFVTLWLRDIAGQSQGTDFVLLLLSALIFWHLYIRVQQSFSMSFLEDVWARNIINFFATPVTIKEFIIGLVSISIVQGFLSFVYIASLATILYALDIWSLGFYLIPFFVNIFIFGWALGLLTIGIIMRFGPSAEILAFFIPFFFLPFSAVYYPVSAFPVFLQNITHFLPTRHMFEGMRTVLVQGTFPLENVLWASGLNIIYFVLGLLFFYWMLRIARKRGLIARLLTD